MIKINMGIGIILVITSARKGHRLERDMREWLMAVALTWGQLTSRSPQRPQDIWQC